MHPCYLLILVLMLLCSVTSTTVLFHTARGQSTVASGEPIDFVTVNDYTNPAIVEVIAGFEFGMNISLYNHNTLRNGVRGRPVRLHTGNNRGNSSLTYPILTDLLTTYPNSLAVVTLVGDDSIREGIRFVKDRPAGKEMVLIQPLSGANEFYKFLPSLVTVISPRVGEVYSLIRHIINNYQATRFAIITEVTEADNVEIAATVKKLVTSVGANVTYHYSLNIDPNNYDLASMSALLATKPHAVLILGGLNPSTAATLLALMMSLPTAYMLCVMTILPLADQAFKQLPSPSIIGSRVIFTTYGPLYTDTSSALTNRFRAELAANPTTQYALSILDAQPTMGTFVYFGWIVTEILVSLTSKLIEADSASMQKYIFDQTIVTVDDYIFGPFSGPCTGSRTLFCSCNTGSRILKLMRYMPTITLETIANSEFYVPVTSCDADTLVLESPLVVATVSPAGSLEAARIISDFLLGRNSALATVSDIAADGTLVQELYATNSTVTLQNLNIERLVTASAGSILNVPITSDDTTAIGALIDPMEVRPRLYAGFRRDVVYVSPTYEQELHAFASLAISKGKGIIVLSALEDGAAVGSTLTRSMNTLGKEGGGHRSASSIATGLLTTGDGGTTVLHGIATSADIAAIATHLRQQTNAVVAIPMAHLLAWYRELVATVTDDSQRSRIVFATSLPNWAGPISSETTGPALQNYFDRVPATNRTPGTLRGYMIHRFITYVSSRVPNLKLTSEFLRMMYGASVIVMDTGLVAGPYFDATCTTSTESCEMNIGARLIRVRSLAASTTTVNGTASGRDESFITLDSGIIAYKSIPGSDHRLQEIIIIVSVVGGLLVLGGVLAVVLVVCCSGRSNWTAPKDEKEPFTIIFTDIQSSTTLWAEVPEAMAPALDHHHALIRKLCDKHNGYEVKTIGDAFMVAFKHATDAVDLSTSLQFDFYYDKTWSPLIDQAYLEMDAVSTLDLNPEDRSMYSLALSPEDYGKVWNGLRVRIGIHTGFGEIKKDPVSHGYDYYGTVVNTAARTESIAHGGQVTLTEATLLACNLSDDRVVAMGPVRLRGVPEPIQMYQLHTVPNRVFPPLRVEKAQEGDDELGELASHQSTKKSDTGSVALLSPRDGGVPTHTNNNLTSAALQRQYTRNVLSTAMVVMPPRAREKLLHNWCNKWRIKLPEATAGLGTSAPTQDDIMLDAIAAKLTPIMMQKSGGTITMIQAANNYNLDVGIHHGPNNSNGSPHSSHLGGGLTPRQNNNSYFPQSGHPDLMGDHRDDGESVSSGMSNP